MAIAVQTKFADVGLRFGRLGDRDDALQYLEIDVDRYHAMQDVGLIPMGPQYELRRGLIVQRDRRDLESPDMPVGTRHMSAVDRLNVLLLRIDREKYHIRTESGLTLPTDGEPLPDGVILRGSTQFWLNSDRRPLASDALCVFEAASSSLAVDRGEKLQDYARDDVMMYVIVNLVEHQVEVYTEPAGQMFNIRRVLLPGQTLTIPLDGDDTLHVSVADLLPQRSSR